ncbi:MAG: hypothetical protein Q4D78_09640, partial [Neisseria zoodegmatis]|uniref:hypothetical protein n=1 Tax=Neisseria zoodegmatis TaxID=326523 RepID=UPI0026EC5B90
KCLRREFRGLWGILQRSPPVTVNTSSGKYRQSTTFSLPAASDMDAVKNQIIASIQQCCSNDISDLEIAVIALSDTSATMELRWWAQGHTDNNRILDEVLSCIQPFLMKEQKD